MFSWCCRGRQGNHKKSNKDAVAVEQVKALREVQASMQAMQKRMGNDAVAVKQVQALREVQTSMQEMRLEKRTENDGDETSLAVVLKKIEKSMEEMRLELNERRLERERVRTNSLKVTGEYFATHKEIWGKKQVKVEPAMGAEALELIQGRIKDWSPAFLKHCQMPLKEDNNEAIHIPKAEWRTNEVEKVFFDSPQASIYNIFFTPAAAKISDSSPTHRSLAHSASESPECSVFWTYFLELLTGEDKVTMDDDDAKLQRFYTVHGLWDFDMTDLDPFHKYRYQGLKNLPQNLLALSPEHEKFYNGADGGNLIIVPIVDLDPSRDADGKYGINSQYDLLVIGNSRPVYNWIYNGEVPSSVSPYSQEIDRSIAEATQEDIEIATAFLEKYAIAAAHLGLQSMKPDLVSSEETGDLWFSKILDQTVAHDKQPEDVSQKSAKTQGSQNNLLVTNIERAKKALVSVEKDGICVPTLWPLNEDHKVMKVKLSEYFKACDLENEFYPAWSLLGFKALANFLIYADQSFIASGETWDPPRNDLPVAHVGYDMESDFESGLSDDESTRWNEYSSGDECDDQS